MPELPEVEVLVRHLRPLVCGRTIRAVAVRRARVLKPTPVGQLQRSLRGARFTGLSRRGKYLVFELRQPGCRAPLILVGHLGMTGRMYLAPRRAPLPKHAAVILDLGREWFVYEDPRYFGRLTLDTRAVSRLGPEPLGEDFTVAAFGAALTRSRQAIKVKLLDQSLVGGVGNIYASEALFRARIAPQLAARKLSRPQVNALRHTIRAVLTEAIRFGSTLPLHYGEKSGGDGLFYFGRAAGAADYYAERLRVYDRKGLPCPRCQTAIRRIVQAARSTFYCPTCQPLKPVSIPKRAKSV
ncbi:MAG: bifunctional DNA-formamidopyrimidine glycosylase/DNA-(apurinic or apyrimidinic site) lyase [Verrucomicrobiota bacterium]|nr:bifunctional DNA-formamidopyrimidine glycosylase/DNA-(apurinic or apyrimidinic site) lyase [Limisphaerales bacterium]